MPTDYIDEPEPEVFDSGYTDAELDAIFAELAKGRVFTWGDEGLSIALAIGISDGDCIAMTEHGTVMLETPRAEIDRRVAAIRTALAAGCTLDAAIEAACGDVLP